MPYQYARLTVKFYKNVIRGNLTSRLCHSVELRMAVIAGGASAASPGDLQGRACCRAERACGIGIRDEDTPPRGNAASSGTRSASAAFCVQNTGGSGYRQDRASVIRRPRKQCFAEQRRGGGAVRRRRSLADGGGKDSAASRRCRRSERGDMPETCCVLPWGIRAVFAAACVAARAAAKMCAPHALSLWSRSRADFESCP